MIDIATHDHLPWSGDACLLPGARPGDSAAPKGPDRRSPAGALPAVCPPSIAALAQLDLAHRLVDGLLHAEGVGALARRVFGHALQVLREERPGRRRRPQFLGEELAAGVAPFV